AHGKRGGGIATGRRREDVGAAFDQLQRELLQSTPGLVLAHAGFEEARQAAGAGRRGTAAQQRLRRGQDGCPAAEQLQQHGVATLLARVRIAAVEQQPLDAGDRKSTRLNSSHVKISYAVFCLKKKKCTSDGSAW